MMWYFRIPASLCALILLAAVGFQANPAYSAKPKVDPDMPTASNPAPWAGKHISGQKCKNPRVSPGGGPYDFRDKRWAGKLNLVEVAHFPERVEQLRSGSTGSVMADIDFILRAFPNHHRALNSAVKYSLRVRTWTEKMAGQPAECYLQRAMVFTPDDPVLYRIYGYYMHQRGRPKLALNANLQALPYWPDDAILHYNTALLLFEAGRYKEAENLARPLYDAGLDLLGLKKKLRAKGYLKTAEELAEEQAKKRAVKQKIKAMKEAAKILADPNNPNATGARHEIDPNNPVAVKPEDKKLAAYLLAMKKKELQRKDKLANYYKGLSNKGKARKQVKAKKGHKNKPSGTVASYKKAMLKLAAAKKAQSGKAKKGAAVATQKHSTPKIDSSREALLKLAKNRAQEEIAKADKTPEKALESKLASADDATLKLASQKKATNKSGTVMKTRGQSSPETTSGKNALLALAKRNKANAQQKQSAKKTPIKLPVAEPAPFKNALLELAERQKYNTAKKKVTPKKTTSKKPAPKKDPAARSISKEEALEIMTKAYRKKKKEKEASTKSSSTG